MWDSIHHGHYLAGLPYRARRLRTPLNQYVCSDGSSWFGSRIVGVVGADAIVDVYRVGLLSIPTTTIAAAGLSTTVSAPISVRLSANLTTVEELAAGYWIGSDPALTPGQYPYVPFELCDNLSPFYD
jgi:hypothetical protein